MKRIAVDLAKSVYQVAERVCSGQVVQRKRLNREAFRQYIQKQAEPVEWGMAAYGTAHYWGDYPSAPIEPVSRRILSALKPTWGRSRVSRAASVDHILFVAEFRIDTPTGNHHDSALRDEKYDASGMASIRLARQRAFSV